MPGFSPQAYPYYFNPLVAIICKCIIYISFIIIVFPLPIKVIDTALDQVASRRAELGATSNRLAYTISNLSSVSENTESARSQIQDADFAVESARLAKSQLLQTTANAMIAQANASGSMVLQLIR